MFHWPKGEGRKQENLKKYKNKKRGKWGSKKSRIKLYVHLRACYPVISSANVHSIQGDSRLEIRSSARGKNKKETKFQSRWTPCWQDTFMFTMMMLQMTLVAYSIMAYGNNSDGGKEGTFSFHPMSFVHPRWYLIVTAYFLKNGISTHLLLAIKREEEF